MYPYQIQGDRITIVVNNRPWTLAEGQIGYAELRSAIKDKAWAAIPSLVSPKELVVSYTDGIDISIINDVISYKGTPVGDGIGARIVSMWKEGFEITPMVTFLDRVMKNPSKISQRELFEFLDNNDLPITPDGHFLAYKKVRDDYMDCHSGTIRNSVGAVVSMDRDMVDDNRRNECSRGLHFCSYSYLAHFGGKRVMILKIDPADVVSIPTDYDRAKGRCWRYEVVGEVPDGHGNVLSNGPSVAEPIITMDHHITRVLMGLSQRKLHDVAVAVDSQFVAKADGRIRNTHKRDIVDRLIEHFNSTLMDVLKTRGIIA